jgi:hypothetical protein
MDGTETLGLTPLAVCAHMVTANSAFRRGLLAQGIPVPLPRQARSTDCATIHSMTAANAGDAIGPEWRVFRPSLKRVARRMTVDPDIRADLLQEATIALWQTDPTRFDLRDEADRQYLFAVLRNRMLDVWRFERRRCVSN